MSSDSPSMKRKRTKSNAEKCKVVLSTRPASELGPVVASFPSAEPPQETPFQCYYVDEAASDSRNEIDFVDQSIFIAGESKRIEFVTADVPAKHDAGTRYIVGIRSKSSKTLTIRDAPFHIVRRDVKRLKLLTPISSTQATERATQRSKLGEAFGTKKVIKALKARERNQVDVSTMAGVLGIIGEGVEERTGGLPTEEQAKEIADSSRPIPPYDPSATKVEEVYTLSSLIPDPELNSIRVSNMLSAEDDTARLRMLPYSRSSYIATRIHDLQLGNGQVITSALRRRLQILVYMSSLFAIRTMRQKISDRKTVNERLRALPQSTVEGILKRFTEKPRGSEKMIMTSQKETLILTNLFALSLHIDNFVVDTTMMAKDLSMSSATVNQLYKALGCKIELPKSIDYARLDVEAAALGGSKRAILRIPLQFPKDRSGKRKKR